MIPYTYVINQLRNNIRHELYKQIDSVRLIDLQRALDDIEADCLNASEIEVLNQINYPDGELLGIQEKQLSLYMQAYAIYFEKQKSYTQLIITAGYASFFGLWTILQPKLSDSIYIVSGICILISVSFFVLYEVFTMILGNTQISYKSKILIEAKKADDMEIRTKKMLSINRHDDLLQVIQTKSWVIFTSVSVITGLAAIGILIFGLFTKLLK